MCSDHFLEGLLPPSKNLFPFLVPHFLLVLFPHCLFHRLPFTPALYALVFFHFPSLLWDCGDLIYSPALVITYCQVPKYGIRLHSVCSSALYLCISDCSWLSPPECPTGTWNIYNEDTRIRKLHLISFEVFPLSNTYLAYFRCFVL